MAEANMENKEKLINSNINNINISINLNDKSEKINIIKNGNKIENEKNMINIINDEEKVLIKTFIKNFIYESLFKKIKLLEYQKNLIIKIEKKENKKREIFLYDTIQSNKKKKKNNKNTTENTKEAKLIREKKFEDNEKIETNEEEKNNSRNNKYKESIPSHINSITFTSIKDETPNKEVPTIKENSILLNGQNNINGYPNVKKLHTSIIEYYNILEEALIIQRKIKTEVVNYFSNIIKNVYPNSSLYVYGSSLYNLDIDTSDLDLSISIKDNISLADFEKYLKENNKNNQYTKINAILSASVPIIKLEIDYLKLENNEIYKLYETLITTDYYTKNSNVENIKYINKINVDFSLNSINNNQIDFIKSCLSEYPEIRPLIKIIKKILQLNNMNNSYHGGMSSYCLFLLIYSYIKFYHHQMNYIENNNINYGSLLIGVLSFYSQYIDFNYTKIVPYFDNPFVTDYSLNTIPTIIEPVSKQNASKTIYKIFEVVDFLKKVNNDIFKIINSNNKNNLIFELMAEYSTE